MSRLPRNALPITESQLQRTLVGAARVQGWLVAHFRPARSNRGRGWQTPVEGDAGFVDLVLARGGVVFCWELKGYNARGQLGKPTPAQRRWLAELGPLVDARVVTPDELDDALAALELGRWPG